MAIDTTKMVQITFTDGKSIKVPSKTTLLELANEAQAAHKTRIVAGKVNNDIKELTYPITEDGKVEFIDLSHEDGMRIYRRSLYCLFLKAVNDVFPERKAIISHSISKGAYCEIKGSQDLVADDVAKVESRMRELSKAAIPFIKKLMTLDEARDVLLKSGRPDRFHAIEYRTKPYVTIYNCDGYEDYFYGYMVPDTSYVTTFELRFHAPGLIVRFPEKGCPDVIPPYSEQKKLFSIFKEYKRWGKILGVENVGAVNDLVKAGQVGELIRISEALHEKKIAQIADLIAFNEEKKRIVLISGPSSSGKTTFANRLAIQLRVNGLKPVTISLDDYFVDRERTPLDESGDYDYEALEAIDVELFNCHLASLISSEEVEIPIFNFHNGCRDAKGRKLKINDDHVLVVEGIHGLNEKLTQTIPRASKFKVYVSALTSMNIDDHNRIPTTDTRIIRRIVRDFQFRSCSATNTIKRWPSVRRGEDRNIFPFQEEADIMFNSSLMFELGVLKALAEPVLLEIDSDQPEYAEARRLIEFLSYFLPIETKEIPFNSIIREFVGGSCFY